MKKYDVFISYAVEDKNIVEELVVLLREKEIKVYYTGNELDIGSSVSTVIYEGMRKSRYVVLILSPDYKRDWPAIERSSFSEKEQKKKQLLTFPVRHRITHEDVSKTYPNLADRWGLSTDIGMESLADKLAQAIKKKKKSGRLKIILRFALIIPLVVVLFSPSLWVYREKKKASSLPSVQMVEEVVQEHMQEYQEELSNDLAKNIAKEEGIQSSFRSMVNDYNKFVRLQGYERNEYQFFSKWFYLSGKKRLEETGIPISETPYQAYGISVPDIYVLEQCTSIKAKANFVCRYIFSNERKATFKVDTIFRVENEAHAIISYDQNIRVVYNSLKCCAETNFVKKQQVKLYGYKPTEEYIFERKNNTWIFRKAE